MKLLKLNEYQTNTQLISMLLNNNIAIFVDTSYPAMYSDKIYVYFITNENWYKSAKRDNSYLLKFPYDESGDNAIFDIWNEMNTVKYADSEYIIGIMEGIKDDTYGTITLDMCSVRPEFRRKGITTKMIDAIREQFKDYDIEFSDTSTQDGKAFVTNYTKY